MKRYGESKNVSLSWTEAKNYPLTVQTVKSDDPFLCAASSFDGITPNPGEEH